MEVYEATIIQMIKPMYDVISLEIIPKYNVFIEELKATTPETTEVSEIHNLFKEGNAIQLDAYLLLLDGLEKQDSTLVDGANELFAKSQETIDQFETKLQAAADEHNLVFN